MTRGNHDRAHTGAAYATCRVGEWQGNDCFHDQFFPGHDPTFFRRDLQGLRVLGIDTYDKPGNGGDPGGCRPTNSRGSAPSWPRTATNQPWCSAIIRWSCRTRRSRSSPSNSLDADQAAAILGDYAAMPGMFLHHAGHTHRNKYTVSPIAPDVIHQEIAAGKEYPGGFSLLRLHTDGFALNFYKSRSELARQWSERSRQEILGFWPQFALGSSVADRNLVATHDLSGLNRRRRTDDPALRTRPVRN